MMFLALGLVTVILGILTMFFVPDTPWQAWFFAPEEKVNLLEHVRVNQSGITNKSFQPRQVLEGLLDIQMWIVFIVIVTVSPAASYIGCQTSLIMHRLALAEV